MSKKYKVACVQFTGAKRERVGGSEKEVWTCDAVLSTELGIVQGIVKTSYDPVTDKYRVIEAPAGVTLIDWDAESLHKLAAATNEYLHAQTR